jgi:hypothetical protein
MPSDGKRSLQGELKIYMPPYTIIMLGIKHFNSNKCDSPCQRVLFSGQELMTVRSRNSYYHMGIQPDIPVVGGCIFTSIDL